MEPASDSNDRGKQNRLESQGLGYQGSSADTTQEQLLSPRELLMDAEKDDGQITQTTTSESQKDARIIGDLTADGIQILGIPVQCLGKAEVFHCFTMVEIRHVLSQPGPYIVNLSGIESLDSALAVHEMIRKKMGAETGWDCPMIDSVGKLGEISQCFENLHKKVLPEVERKWKLYQGNTKATAKALRVTSQIRKKAHALRGKVQGSIGAEFCRLMEKDPPSYMQDNADRLAEMAGAELKKSVWFLAP